MYETEPLIDNGISGYYGVAQQGDQFPTINWAGLGNTATELAKVWGAVEIAKSRAQTPLYQYGPNGVLYREGVPVSGGMQQGGTLSPIMLLILVGIAAFALAD
jgi:hypothetical protein